MKLGIVGATGLVGQNFLKLLEEEAELPFKELKLFSRSAKACSFKGKSRPSEPLNSSSFEGLDICFFSAGEAVSRRWAPEAAAKGAVVIDNSSAFRKDPDKLLIVPEINGDLLKYKPQIISNPNCSTIQLVMALQGIHEAFELKSVRIASLQSISGAGSEALEDLKRESRGVLEGKISYSQEKMSAAFNAIPYIGNILPNGFCKEEDKIMTESRKILRLPELLISAFTVRIAALNAHSEAVWFSVKKAPGGKKEVEQALSRYVKVQEPPPHARSASGKKEVFAGRIHKDSFGENSWLMWLAADNLLKGASLNGLQIAKKLWKIRQN